jgi:hypothetical protein
MGLHYKVFFSYLHFAYFIPVFFPIGQHSLGDFFNYWRLLPIGRLRIKAGHKDVNSLTVTVDS